MSAVCFVSSQLNIQLLLHYCRRVSLALTALPIDNIAVTCTCPVAYRPAVATGTDVVIFCLLPVGRAGAFTFSRYITLFYPPNEI